MVPTALRGCAHWLTLGLFVWPALALAPQLEHPQLWTAILATAEDAIHGDAVTRPPRKFVDWIVLSNDNDGLSFLVIDKEAAQLHVFDAAGRFVGTTPIVLGAARGDESVPGIGERPLGAILPGEKTTPAGRFIAERGRNLNGEDIFWVDYDAAVSLHRVRAANPRERRLERLATPTAADNRISFGCINVPVAFYKVVVQRAFTGGRAVVYSPSRDTPGIYRVQPFAPDVQYLTSSSRRRPGPRRWLRDWIPVFTGMTASKILPQKKLGSRARPSHGKLQVNR